MTGYVPGVLGAVYTPLASTAPLLAPPLTLPGTGRFGIHGVLLPLVVFGLDRVTLPDLRLATVGTSCTVSCLGIPDGRGYVFMLACTPLVARPSERTVASTLAATLPSTMMVTSTTLVGPGFAQAASASSAAARASRRII